MPAKPVILTVDDDVSVSRAVARDLRRRYGEGHRIVRAESGESALEALRELRVRDEPVAVLLADYRMPEMSGLQFLEQAMDIHPRARRALLTAYADTDAAIQAINVVDLDHYLLKPWDPPEEHLYPVVDTLLELWAATAGTAGSDVSTRLIGHRWSSRTHDVRDFLGRNAVPYRYLPSDEPEGQRTLEAAGLDESAVPVLLTAAGQALPSPTNAEVAAAVGLSTEPATDFYDLVVIGAGPAGLGAAVYGATEGLRTVLVEREATGGQAGQSARIENYLGFPDGVSGAQLTERARRQALRFGAELLTAREVVRLEARGPARVVVFDDGSEIAAHTVVLATGVTYRLLDAAGLADLTGRGVFYGAAAFEAPACADHDVYLVGGANSAGQAAVYISRYARSVTLLVRGERIEQSMSHYLIEELAALPNVQIRTCAQVIDGGGDKHLEWIEVLDSTAGTKERMATEFLFVFIGAAPRTDWLDGVVRRDERGFVLAGPDLLVESTRPPGWDAERDPWHLETSVPGVFVAGDVRADSVKRVASAVGEGAMAVTLVHRYLEKL
ncbi:MAG TPA: FAD-dependent oxidoreductase [Jiangellaceae bacterium]|nr:FAD-dependent oxidoreductase [Jiangellaceae bacterium]